MTREELADSMTEPVAALAEFAREIRAGTFRRPGDMANALRQLVGVWRAVAAGEPQTLTQEQCTVGTRVMVQPFTQCAATRGNSRPIRIPFVVPGTVVETHIPDSVIVDIDPDLYGHRAWDKDQQLFIPSRGELHAVKCTCVLCQYGDLLGA